MISDNNYRAFSPINAVAMPRFFVLSAKSTQIIHFWRADAAGERLTLKATVHLVAQDRFGQLLNILDT